MDIAYLATLLIAYGDQIEWEKVNIIWPYRGGKITFGF